MSNAILALKENNPNYFALCVSRSEYSENEILDTLSEIERINAQLNSFLTEAYKILVWENGTEMNYIPNGFASDNHQKLNLMLSQISSVSAYMSDNSHMNCFPVRKWQKSIASLEKEISKIEKFIQKSF